MAAQGVEMQDAKYWQSQSQFSIAWSAPHQRALQIIQIKEKVMFVFVPKYLQNSKREKANSKFWTDIPDYLIK